MPEASNPINELVLDATHIFVWLREDATVAEIRVWEIFQTEIHTVYRNLLLLEVDSYSELDALGERLIDIGYVGGDNVTGALNRLYTWWLPTELD